MDCVEFLNPLTDRIMTTILISDIHLGARNNRTDLLAELLRGDFDRLLRLGRSIALLSPEVVAVQEFERFRLTVEFHWRCRAIALGLLLGTATLPQISAVSDQVSHLAVRLEAALKEMGERAVLAVELASAPDRRNLNTV